jgi:hypothetical protein
MEALKFGGLQHDPQRCSIPSTLYQFSGAKQCPNLFKAAQQYGCVDQRLSVQSFHLKMTTTSVLTINLIVTKEGWPTAGI